MKRYNIYAWTNWEGYFMGLWRVSVHLLSRACTKGRVLPVSRLLHQKTVIKKISAIDTVTFKSYYQHYVSIMLWIKERVFFKQNSKGITVVVGLATNRYIFIKLWRIWRFAGKSLRKRGLFYYHGKVEHPLWWIWYRLPLPMLFFEA